MLDRSFVFLPGIGPVREARLWRSGVEHWADYRSLKKVRGIKPHIKERHDSLLELAQRHHGRDPSFFARVLPTPEHWRSYACFADGAAYLDIETTGDRRNLVTVVGVRKRGENRAFVRGVDYTAEAVSRFLADASCVVTFNGGPFDVPVLKGEGVVFPDAPHVDLRTVFSRVGHTGGLKRIEEDLGLAREDELAGLTGYDAVKLWRRWERKGDQDALERLVAYNVADFENLEPLAGYACETLQVKLLQEARQERRLDVAEAEAAAPRAGP